MPGIFLLNPAPVYQDPNQQVVHEDTTITANGSSVLFGYGATEITLFVNVKSAPSGTNPTLQYTIQEIDPGDGTTAIGATANSTVISGVSVQKVVLLSTHGGTFKISWVIGGTDTPTFTGVYATVVSKAGSIILTDSSGVAFGTSGSPIRIDPTGTTSQPVNQGNAGTHAQRWMVGLSDGSSSFISPATDRTTAAGPFSIRLSDGSSFYNAPTSTQFPTSLVGSRLDINNGAWLGSTAPTVGQKASTASIPVVIANDQSSIAVTATNPSVGTTGSTLPTSATEVGGSDGTNLQTPRVFDADSGVGTQWVLGVQLRASGSGGSTEIGTSGSPIRIDPTGTTNQPVNQGNAGTHAQRWMVGLSDGSSSFISPATDRTTAVGPFSIRLSDGSAFYNAKDQGSAGTHAQRWMVGLSDGSSNFISPATDRTTAAGPFSIRLSDGSSFYNAPTSTQFPTSLVGSRLDINNGAWLGSTAPTVGQKASTASIPVVIANDQSSIAVTATNPSVGTVGSTLPTSATEIGGSDGTNLQTPRVFDADSGGGTQWVLGVQLRASGSGGSAEIGTSGSPIRIDPTGTTAQPITATQLPATLVGSRLDINNGAWLGSTAPTVGQKTSANSIPVVIASDQSTVSAINPKSATGTTSRVSSSASSVQLLAANTNRYGVIVVNDSSQTLYLKFGTTASATDYTYKIRSQATVEIIYGSLIYTGRIDGIWAAANGAAQITELTA